MAKSKSTEYLKSISNQLRESSDVYAKAIPKLTQNSDINDLKNPLFTNELLYNTFYTGFTNMIAKTVFAVQSTSFLLQISIHPFDAVIFKVSLVEESVYK